MAADSYSTAVAVETIQENYEPFHGLLQGMPLEDATDVLGVAVIDTFRQIKDLETRGMKLAIWLDHVLILAMK